MTAPTKVAVPDPGPDREHEYSHPDWDTDCVDNPDGTVTHRHLMGRVGEVAVVYVTQTDSTDDRGKKHSTPKQVVAQINRAADLSPAEVTRLNRLTHQGAVLAGQRMERGCL
jgi:hypothetical protein